MRNRMVLSLAPGLLRSLLASTPPEPRKPKKPKGQKGGNWNVTQPDALILEMRRLKEHCGWAPAQIQHWCKQQGFDVKRDRVYSVLGYNTRSHLVPDSTDKPYYP